MMKADVVIVGAGPAGMMAAIMAARRMGRETHLGQLSLFGASFTA